MIGYVYRATNKINNRVYIGQTVDLEKRKIKHILESRSGWGCWYFHNALRKYGESNFEWDVVEKIEAGSYDELKRNLCDRERYYIKEFKTNYRDGGYNLTSGGENPPLTSTLPNSKEIYKEIAKKTSKRMMGCGNPMYGKTITEEHRKKLSEAKIGRKLSTTTKEKMSANAIGKNWEERYGAETARQAKLKKSLASKAQTNFCTKLSAEDVEFILANKDFYPRKDLIKKFNISRWQLWKILTGRCKLEHYPSAALFADPNRLRRK
jgi:group I intron endonuclease